MVKKKCLVGLDTMLAVSVPVIEAVESYESTARPLAGLSPTHSRERTAGQPITSSMVSRRSASGMTSTSGSSAAITACLRRNAPLQFHAINRIAEHRGYCSFVPGTMTSGACVSGLMGARSMRILPKSSVTTKLRR